MSLYKEKPLPADLDQRLAPQPVAAGERIEDALQRAAELDRTRVAEDEKRRISESIEEARKKDEERQAELWKSDFIALLAGSRVFKIVKIVVGLVVVVFLCSNLIDLARVWSDPNVVVRVLSWFVSALIVVGLVACAWQAISLSRALPRFQQRKVGADDEPADHSAALKEYIDAFPEDDVSLAKLDHAGVCISDKIKELRRIAPDTDAKAWMDKFREFQSAQREIARKISMECAKLVGVKTAACPWKAGDVLITFVNTSLMVTAIARAYNRKVSSMAALRLVFKWMGQLYVVGRMQDFSEATADGASSFFSAPDGWDGVLSTFAPALKAILGKSVEGAVNAYMAYRLGLCAANEFSAVVFQD